MNFEIERRTNLSYAEFAENYERANRPVVVTDAIRQWKALSRWTPEFFRKEFGDMRVEIDDNKKEKTEYKGNGRVEFSIAQFIDRVLTSTDEDPAPYLRNQALAEIFPGLEHDVDPLPGYFFPNWLAESYLMKHTERLFNRYAKMEIYIGGKGAAFPVLHYDAVCSHAFLMQIYGRKRFILYGPEQESYLYARLNVSGITDVERPDLNRFPLFVKAEPTTFILEPGELLFIPSKWWHTTKMLTPSISVSVNTVNRSNWPALIDFMASGRRPLMRTPVRIYLTLAGYKRSRRDKRSRIARPSPA